MSISRMLTQDEASCALMSRQFGENRDCAVRAVALTTKVGYSASHAALKAAGRKDKHGTFFHQTQNAVKALGFEMRRTNFKPCTTRTVTKQLPKTGSFLVRVNRHILAVRDGIVMDWTEGRLMRVLEIHEVVKAGTPVSIAKPVVIAKPRVHIDFVEIREALRTAMTIDQLIARFGGDSNQIRTAIDRARRYGANIRNVARNTFQLV